MTDLTSRETLILHNNPPNSSCKLGDIKTNINKINDSEFIKRLQNNYYDPVVMMQTMCIVNSILYNNDYDTIRKFFDNLKQIGSNSAEGYALLSYFEHISNAFIIKVAREEAMINSDYDIIKHEYFIGSYGTNKLRLEHSILNFSFILGLFKCNEPVIGSDKKVNNFCTMNNNIRDFVIYENILPSIQYNNYTINSTTTFEDWLNIYIQIVLALDTANRTIDFTHYDLHDQNVMVRDYGKKILLPYKLYNGKIIYIETSKIGTIIDYGRSFIRYNNQPFGITRLEEFGISPTQSFPLYDPYKLLVWSMFNALKNNKMDMFNKMRILLNYFNISTYDIYKFINDAYYTSCLTDIKLRHKRLDSFINYIFNNFPKLAFIKYNNNNNNTVLSCNNKIGGNISCIQDSTYYEDIFDSNVSNNKIMTLYDVYNKYRHFNSKYKKEFISDLKAKYNYNELYNNRNIDNNIEYYINMLNDKILKINNHIMVQNFYDIKQFNSLQKYLNELINILHIFKYIIYSYHVKLLGKNIFNIVDNDNTKEDIHIWINKLERYKTEIQTILYNYYTSYNNYLNSYNIKDIFNKINKSELEEMVNFYNDKFNNYINTFK